MNRRTEMKTSVGALLDGALTGEEAVQFLTTQDITRLQASELAGAVDAVMERAIPFPEFPDALDCCGTGGDSRNTYNISTAAAIVAAARGVQVAKHGNRAVTSQSGSADVLTALGVNVDISPDRAAAMLHEIGLCFLVAPTFHPGFATIAPIRRAVGKRTIFNLLGPLCNPARVKRQLIGVFANEYCALMAETAQLLGHTECMAVHGADGSDEISISGGTHAAWLHEGSITYSALRPQDATLPIHPADALTGGDAKTNAKALRAVLAGAENAYADAVVFNAAALLLMAGRAPSFHAGVALARSTIARGDATRKLNALIEASNA